MGDDIGSVPFVFVFHSTYIVQLFTAEYVEKGRMILKGNLSLNPDQCHHPLITQLMKHYWHCVFGILYLIFWLHTLNSLLYFTSAKFRKRSFMSTTLFAYFLRSIVLFYRYLDYLQNINSFLEYY